MNTRKNKHIYIQISLIILDIILTAVIVLSIYYFTYVMPQRIGLPIKSTLELVNYNLDSNLPKSKLSVKECKTAGSIKNTNWKDKYASHFTNKIISTDTSYSSPNIAVNINKYTSGFGNDKITYYVADVYVSNMNCFKTYFAEDTYGVGYKEHLTAMSAKVKSILAINGDSYCYNEKDSSGLLIRNGLVYRKERTDADVCVLYKNGAMVNYNSNTINTKQVIKNGALQTWVFGPSLIDNEGKANKIFNTSSYIKKTNPRTAIGYYEPGHYCFVIVDGRKKGYSRGMTLQELALVFEKLGCKVAYNLDGGHSSFMTKGTNLINKSYQPDTAITDCIYICEP